MAVALERIDRHGDLFEPVLGRPVPPARASCAANAKPSRAAGRPGRRRAARKAAVPDRCRRGDRLRTRRPRARRPTPTRPAAVSTCTPRRNPSAATTATAPWHATRHREQHGVHRVREVEPDEVGDPRAAAVPAAADCEIRTASAAACARGTPAPARATRSRSSQLAVRARAAEHREAEAGAEVAHRLRDPGGLAVAGGSAPG